MTARDLAQLLAGLGLILVLGGGLVGLPWAFQQDPQSIEEAASRLDLIATFQWAAYLGAALLLAAIAVAVISLMPAGADPAKVEEEDAEGVGWSPLR